MSPWIGLRVIECFWIYVFMCLVIKNIIWLSALTSTPMYLKCFIFFNLHVTYMALPKFLNILQFLSSVSCICAAKCRIYNVLAFQKLQFFVIRWMSVFTDISETVKDMYIKMQFARFPKIELWIKNPVFLYLVSK